MLITSTTLGSAACAATATVATVYSDMPYARGFAQKFASPPPILLTAYNAVFTVCSSVSAKKICCQKFLSSVINKLVKLLKSAALASVNSGNTAVFTVGAGAIPKNNSDRTTLSIPVENFLNPTAFLYYIWRGFVRLRARFATRITNDATFSDPALYRYLQASFGIPGTVW